MIDFIGDIHGYADELEKLLSKLGYSKDNGTYVHPDRKVLFVGDYIDRGPKIRETLQIVRSMVERGNAIALMGNHEYNALCFHFQESEGGHLRKHEIKNIIQHYETLKQFENRQDEYEDYLEWFKTLPLYYETETFKAVHACWDNQHIEFLRNTLENDRLTDEHIYQSVKKGTKLNLAVEETLKGKEIKMPNGLFFKDHQGTQRTEIRIKWWEDPSTMTYKSISVEHLESLPEFSIELSELSSLEYHREDEKNVFFGHYWLKEEP
ncbi:MAG: metallophosphoesterase, partial [Bacteroidota bacterium]